MRHIISMLLENEPGALSRVVGLFSQRNYNIAEDSGIKTGDYYDALADAAGLPRPPRMTRAEAEATLSPMRLSFLSESRRIKNERMKRELRFTA